MAEKQQLEVKETEGKTDEVKTEEVKPVEKKLYKLTKNVKYGESVHKIGEKIEIASEHLEEFIKAEAIKIEEE